MKQKGIVTGSQDDIFRISPKQDQRQASKVLDHPDRFDLQSNLTFDWPNVTSNILSKHLLQSIFTHLQASGKDISNAASLHRCMSSISISV
jgi:hypothetical protein